MAESNYLSINGLTILRREPSAIGLDGALFLHLYERDSTFLDSYRMQALVGGFGSFGIFCKDLTNPLAAIERTVERLCKDGRVPEGTVVKVLVTKDTDVLDDVVDNLKRQYQILEERN